MLHICPYKDIITEQGATNETTRSVRTYSNLTVTIHLIGFSV